jgi:predicted peptidase
MDGTMVRWIALIPLVGLLGGCPVPQPRPPGPILRVTEERTGAKYSLYVPTNYSDKRDWPLVVTLHGTHGWDGPKRQVAEWGSLAETRGFIVVAPHLKSVQGIFPVIEDMWHEDLTRDERLVLAVIDEVSRKYRVDRKAVLLTGFSAGGYPLYFIGLRNPDRFNMLIARDCNSSVRLLEQLQLTEDARNLPIAIFWGKDDLSPIKKQSWEAFAWLRRHKFYNAKQHQIAGGHLRRPDVAYRLWVLHLPPRHRM